MASPLNYDDTKDIFHSNKYYVLDHESAFIFQQGTLPNFYPEGEILLADEANKSTLP